MADKVFDNASLALLGTGGALILASGTGAVGSNRVLKLLGAGIALAGALRVLANATKDLRTIAGAPLKIAAAATEAGEKAALHAIDSASKVAERVQTAADEEAQDVLFNVLGPPPPPAEQVMVPLSGERVPASELPPLPFISTDVGFASGTNRVLATLVNPPDGGEQDIGTFDRFFVGTVEVRNQTDNEQAPVIEYEVFVEPQSIYSSTRTVRRTLTDNNGNTIGKLGPREVRHLEGVRFDIGGFDPFNTNIAFRFIVNNVQVQSTAFVLT